MTFLKAFPLILGLLSILLAEITNSFSAPRLYFINTLRGILNRSFLILSTRMTLHFFNCFLYLHKIPIRGIIEL
ncbi:predicted protein [Enterococcus faecium Com15]|nr:predicted protein [Enterococcus faecium Com15]